MAGRAKFSENIGMTRHVTPGRPHCYRHGPGDGIKIDIRSYSNR